MNMEEALKYIHGVSWLGTIPGLEREQELLGRIGNPHRGMKYIHVAGTNGKGSTAAMLASILRRAGYRTGLYTRPTSSASTSASRWTANRSPTRPCAS